MAAGFKGHLLEDPTTSQPDDASSSCDNNCLAPLACFVACAACAVVLYAVW
jgi:hypothetical protein